MKCVKQSILQSKTNLNISADEIMVTQIKNYCYCRFTTLPLGKVKLGYVRSETSPSISFQENGVTGLRASPVPNLYLG